MNKEVFDLFGYDIYVSDDHRFGTDALLLAEFSKPSSKDIVCDLCSGCGIIPMLFFAWGKAPAKAYSVEIQDEAVALMNETAEKNSLSDRFIPVKADLTKDDELFTVPRGKMTLVTVNPPYYKAGSGEERLSPAQANARHELLCDLESVIRAASLLLKYGGYLKMCHLPERLTDIFCLMRKYGIEPKVMRFAHHRDTSEKPYLVLVSGKKGGRSGLIVEKPVTVEEMDKRLFGDRIFLDVSVKKLDENETENALRLVWEVFLQYEAPDYTQDGTDEFYKSIHDENYLSRLKIYGAFIGSKLVGVIATRNEGKHIALFFVDGKYHQKGIGKKLFEAVRTERMTVNSSPCAVPIYQKLGFVPTDNEQVVNGLRFTPMQLEG